MSDDIVERLRGLARLLTFAKTKSNAGFDKICEQAADEIEHLRAHNKRLTAKLLKIADGETYT